MKHFQFTLLLEYCSNGDLRSYLITNREEFERSLKHYTEKGRIDHCTSSDKAGTSLDIMVLCRWAYQVSPIFDIEFSGSYQN
jgi:hypothetical protein